MSTTNEQEHDMPDISTDPSTANSPAVATPQTWARITLRWMVSFTGFPLGGFLALTLIGPVDGLSAALVGGLVTGAVLGAVQVWSMGAARPSPAGWIVATALGLMTGLGLGSWLVDYQSDIGSLVIQGVVSGALVGAAQAVLLLPRLGSLALVWPVALGAIWAAGWAITTSAGIQVDEQFTVFGSSGAIVATLLTAVLPVILNRHHTEKSAS